MRSFIGAAIMMASLTLSGPARAQNTRIVLPNPKLIGCEPARCSQLWQEGGAVPHAVYPKQVLIDVFASDSRPRGILALYDKSVSMDDIKAAIDELYGKWALSGNGTLPVKLWRVEPEKFAIQLAVVDEADTRTALSRALAGLGPKHPPKQGMKQVIFLAIQPW